MRKTRHEVETDLATMVRNSVQARKRREWNPMLEGVRDRIPRLESDGTPGAQVFRGRLDSIEACVGMADGMAQRFLDGGVLSNLGLQTLTTAARTRRRRRQT
jgi:hypothetical protein